MWICFAKPLYLMYDYCTDSYKVYMWNIHFHLMKIKSLKQIHIKHLRPVQRFQCSWPTVNNSLTPSSMALVNLPTASHFCSLCRNNKKIIILNQTVRTLISLLPSRLYIYTLSLLLPSNCPLKIVLNSGWILIIYY